MAIGKRIKFFRKKKGFTQKQLGRMLGFFGKTSDVRMAQYEAEARIPKQELVKSMANIFEVSPNALTVPNIDNYIGLLHTFFALEDLYGLKITIINDEICLHLDKSDISLFQMFHKRGRSSLQNWNRAKLRNSNMTSGDTITLNLTPLIVGQKFHRRQSVTFLHQNWITKVTSKKIKKPY